MRAVSLEFIGPGTTGKTIHRVMGSDAIMYRDGRWSDDTFYAHALEREATLCKRHPDIRLVGYTPLGASYRPAPMHIFPSRRALIPADLKF